MSVKQNDLNYRECETKMNELSSLLAEFDEMRLFKAEHNSIVEGLTTKIIE